jgi:ParB family chromosome partitioning protein
MARPKRPRLDQLDVDGHDDDGVARAYARSLSHTVKPRILELAVDRIDPNPYQARQAFVDIDELEQSIRTYGFTSRLRVRPHPTVEGRFQLVYGERRLRAAIAAGLTQIPVEVVAHQDDEMIEIGLIENIQRADLQPLEEAEGLKTLMDRNGYSIRQLAERIGKSAGYVQGRLEVLRAPQDVRDLVGMRPDTLQAARVLARMPDAAARGELIGGLRTGALTGEVAAARARAQMESLTLSADQHPHPMVQLDAIDPRKGTAIDRILRRDIPRLDSMFIRWSQALDDATPEEAGAIAAYITERLLHRAEILLRQATDRTTNNET